MRPKRSIAAFVTLALLTSTLAQTLPDNTARVHYFRPDGQYTGWGLHAWEDTAVTVDWAKPLAQSGKDDFGAYWDVPMKGGWQKLGFIVHQGDSKDPGPDMFLLSKDGKEAWVVSGDNTVYTQKPDTAARKVGDLTKSQAMWLTRDLIAVKPELLANGALVNLYASPSGGLKLTAAGIEGGTELPLVRVDGGLNAALKAKYPYLAGYALVQVRPEDAAKVPELLRGQVALSSTGLDDKLIDATGVQLWGALDDLDAYGGPLGLSWEGGKPTLRLWAPTAQEVKLHLFSNGQERAISMTRGEKGVWSAVGDAAWKGQGYLYEVKVYAPSTGKVEANLVTDPYAVALTLNSERGVIADLNDPASKPHGWDALKKPELRSFADLSIYELHLRDFSAADPSVPQAQRGTYLAFTNRDSDGMKQLRALSKAGLRAVHLLPTFDIATTSINEDKSSWQTPGDLSKFPPDSDAQQKAVVAVQNRDAYNWGYDPYHYLTPEGSYAVNPDERTLEYRRMVAALNGIGLRVIQDVVFNHTAASGQAPMSVLDRIVPGYYQRLNLDGAVENSTCCANTASEHAMMRKLMVDALVWQARTYKVDGFRFDLMGHHMVADMQAVRAALDALTLAKDGVDGQKIYLYGEGWDFGEVQGGKRGVNATQLNLFGQGIGTFNDRLRDAIRGGNPFGGLQDQGFATGLVSLPNGQPQNTDAARLGHLSDLVKIGLTGNLRDYKLTDSSGKTVTGGQIDYGGAPAGYTASPVEAINYASAHDNQTLWDAVLLKAPRTASTAQRVRMQNLAESLVLLGQGIPFIQAGDELLRSKSFDNDSYNSGDWFNAIHWTGADNGFGHGLPVADKNGDQWNIYKPLLADPQLRVTEADRTRASDHLREMLAVRASSTLFRLGTGAAVQRGLSFLKAAPGVIAMKLSGQPGEGNPYRSVVVVFNGTGAATTVNDPALSGLGLSLHPVLAKSSDPVVQQSRASGNTLSVPGLTTVVFVGR